MASHPEKHLAVLGLQSNATPSEIRSAYKRLAIQWHPDKNKSEEATSKFQEISHSYTALTDPDYRSDNDHETEFSASQEGLERFMNLFQQAFSGSQDNINFVFSGGPSLFFDARDDIDNDFEPKELFPLQLVESTANSMTIDWSEGLTELPSCIIYRLDICSPERSLPWNVCYVGFGQQCKITGLLPETQYELRLGVVDDCNKVIDISSESSFVTKGNMGKRRVHIHPKISLSIAVSNCSDLPELSYEWNMNRIAIYEKLVIDPDVDMSMPRRFDFGDDDDDLSFEMVERSGSDDFYDEYAMYSDGEMPDEIYSTDDYDNVNFFRRMNLNPDPAYFRDSVSQGDSDSNVSPPRKLPESNKLCRFFLQGACRYGNSCRFSHDPFHQNAFDCDINDSVEECSDTDNNQQPIPRMVNPKAKSMPPCRFFQAGNCKKWNCRFSHDIKPNFNDIGKVNRTAHSGRHPYKNR